MKYNDNGTYKDIYIKTFDTEYTSTELTLFVEYIKTTD